jgi:hypothetical protein
MASPSLFAGVVVVQSAVWEVNGHLYDLLANQSEAGGYTGLSWTDAENYAAANGGYLATVDSAATQAWIWSQFGSANYYYWIGLTDRVIEGQYIWVGTGQPATYYNWYPGEPNNFGDEDYTLVLRGGFVGGNGPGEGMWNDFQNLTDFIGAPNYAVADMGAVPEPASLGMLAVGGVLLAGLRRRV